MTLPLGPSKAVSRAAFSADGAYVGVARAGADVETYALATGARVDAIRVPVAAVPRRSDEDRTLHVDDPKARAVLERVARGIGATVEGAGPDLSVSAPTRADTFGTDGRDLVWFDAGASTTLVRLDTDTHGRFSPWTRGMSGLGARTGGGIMIAPGPNPDRAVVLSVSQAGAAIAYDDPRLVDTRTMRAVGTLVSACQPFGVVWSPRGRYVLRNECMTGRLLVADGLTADGIRSDEALDVLAFSEDEELFAARTSDGGLLVERTRSGEHVLRLSGPTPTAVVDLVFGAKGDRLVVDRDAAVDVWDLASGAGRTVDTRSSGSTELLADADTTAVFRAGQWVRLGDAPAPTEDPTKRPALGRVDPRRLAGRGERFDVAGVVPGPDGRQLLVTGWCSVAVRVADETGTRSVRQRAALFDAASGAVVRAIDGDDLAQADWAWTADGAHVVTRRAGRLAVFGPSLQAETVEPIAMRSAPSVSRLVRTFHSLERVEAAAKILADPEVAPRGPVAIDPSLRFVAFGVGPDVTVVDRTTRDRLTLRCVEVERGRGCLATAADGRWAASPSIRSSVVVSGPARETPDLVASFFSSRP